MYNKSEKRKIKTVKGFTAERERLKRRERKRNRKGATEREFWPIKIKSNIKLIKFLEKRIK